jgi:hypothetical protein
MTYIPLGTYKQLSTAPCTLTSRSRGYHRYQEPLSLAITKHSAFGSRRYLPRRVHQATALMVDASGLESTVLSDTPSLSPE